MSKTIYAIGRRKSAVAKVKLKAGKGNIEINKKKIVDYLQENPTMMYAVQFPLEVVGVQSSHDLEIHVTGGGLSGQTEAIQLGISRALEILDPNHRNTLKIKGLLTRDPRIKERRKYGLKKARKAPQFSKR